MEKIVFYGWEKGMRPIAFTMLLRKKLNLSLINAREVSVQIRCGKSIIVNVPSLKSANKIIKKSIKLGVKAKSFDGMEVDAYLID